MTDIDTTEPVVRLPTWRHPAEGRGHGRRLTGAGDAAVSPDVAEPVEVPRDGADVGDAVILNLNDAASIYQALADEIEGTAVGWSDAALAQLEQGLLQRYGALVGGRQPVRRLVRLASRPVQP